MHNGKNTITTTLCEIHEYTNSHEWQYFDFDTLKYRHCKSCGLITWRSVGGVFLNSCFNNSDSRDMTNDFSEWNQMRKIAAKDGIEL